MGRREGGGRERGEGGREGVREGRRRELGRKTVREEKQPWQTHVNLLLPISLPQVMQERCFIQIHQGTYTHINITDNIQSPSHNTSFTTPPHTNYYMYVVGVSLTVIIDIRCSFIDCWKHVIIRGNYRL